MRSRTSRGVSEWSRGKDLYMGSHILGSGKRCSFFGIVPGSFQKVPEDSGGVRKSTSGSTTSQGLAWAKGRRPGLIGPGAPSPQKPTQLGKEKGRVLVGIGLDFGVQVHVCTIHVVLFTWYCSRCTIPSTPSPYTYINRGEGAPQTRHNIVLAVCGAPLHSSVPRSYFRSAWAKPCGDSITITVTTPSCCRNSSTTSPSCWIKKSRTSPS